MNPIRLIVAILAFAAVGCRCGPTTTTNKTDYDAMPTALSFSACPTKDETGMTVKDVFPDEQKVTIKNEGKAGGT